MLYVCKEFLFATAKVQLIFQISKDLVIFLYVAGLKYGFWHLGMYK